MDWITWALRTALDFLPPVEVALTLGVVFFALSWIRPRPLVSLPSNAAPHSSRRTTTLVWLGFGGALFVLAVGTTTSLLTMLRPLENWDGWWQRPAPLVAAALVLVAAAIALRTEPLPAPGERAIAPLRRWWEFAPRALLLATAAAALLLFFTAAWQSLIGVSAPPNAPRFGIVPPDTDLPVYMHLQQDMGYVWGAGWPNHLATLVAPIAAAVALVWVLAGDANRPVFARTTAATVRAERTATARVIVLLALGGVLLTLGALWAHVGFIGDRAVGIEVADDGLVTTLVTTGYGDFAPLLHKGGYVIQGIGAALLLRLAVDTLRGRLSRENSLGADRHAATTTAATGEVATVPAAAITQRSASC